MTSTTVQHGIIMSVTWAICIPIGIILARYLSFYWLQWLRCHIVVQTCALVLCITGFILAVYLVQKENSPHFSAEYHHASLGLFITIGIILQFIIALLRPKNEHVTRHINPPPTTFANEQPQVAVIRTRPTKKLNRKLFEIFHRTLGLVLFFVAYWNIHTGIELASDEINSDLWQKVLLGVFLGTIILIYLIEIYHMYFVRNIKKSI